MPRDPLIGLVGKPSSGESPESDRRLRLTHLAGKSTTLNRLDLESHTI